MPRTRRQAESTRHNPIARTALRRASAAARRNRPRASSPNLQSPPIQSARFDFPIIGRPPSDDDSTDVENDDGDESAIFQNTAMIADSSSDATDAEGDDEDDVTDAEEDTQEDDSFIVRDSQEIIATDEETDEDRISPSSARLQPVVEIINISDASVAGGRHNATDAVYEGEMSPVDEVSDDEPAVEKPGPSHASSTTKPNLDDTMSDERSACVICCESMTSDGKHEIVVLTGCGHLFGRSCIMEWIKKGKKECPNCKKKTKTGDVRKIYPASMPLVVLDNSETESLRKKVEDMKRVSDDLNRKLTISESQLRQCQSDIKTKDDEIRHLKMNRNHSNSQSNLSQSKINIKFKFLKEETIIPHSSNDISRVMAVDNASQTRSMCVAATTTAYNALSTFSHGIYNIELNHLKKGKFIPLHKDEIKDMEYGSGFLLTGSADKSLKTVDIEANKIQATYLAPQPVWSVTWNRGKHLIYGGLRNGQIVEYDTRVKSKDPMRTIKNTNPMPLHSIYYKNNGLLCAQFKQISWVGLENDYTRATVYSFNDSRSCMSLHIQNDHILATFRAKPPQTEFLHLSFSYTAQLRSAKGSVVSQFVVGPQHHKITKDRLFTINGNTIAACSNQQGGNIALYDPSNSELIQSFPKTKNAILDSATFQIGETVYMAELDGRSVRFHQCISS